MSAGDSASRSALDTSTTGRSGVPTCAADAALSRASMARSLVAMGVKLTVVIWGAMARATSRAVRGGPCSTADSFVRGPLPPNSLGLFPSNLRRRPTRTVRFVLSAHAVKIDRISSERSDALEAPHSPDSMFDPWNCWGFSTICWLAPTEQSRSELDERHYRAANPR